MWEHSDLVSGVVSLDTSGFVSLDPFGLFSGSSAFDCVESGFGFEDGTEESLVPFFSGSTVEDVFIPVGASGD